VKDVHRELLKRLVALNFPQPDVPRIYKKWIPEVATGFRRMKIKEEDIEYNPAWEKDGIKIVDKDWYRMYLQKKLSPKLGNNGTWTKGYPGAWGVVFADCLVVSKDFSSNWVIEIKESLNYEAIGQVLIYKDLLEEDYPWLGSLNMGIACLYGDERLEPTCEKYGIRIFKLQRFFSGFWFG
jgi:hypothetical protein